MAQRQQGRTSWGILLLAALWMLAPRAAGAESTIVCYYMEDQYYYGFARLLCQHLRRELEGSIPAERIVERGSAPGIGKIEGAMDLVAAVARSPRGDQGSTERTHAVGLTQSDVAYYFRHGGGILYRTPHRDRRNVVSVARVMPECLHVYSSEPLVAGETSLEHAARWRELRLGPLGSGTLITSTNVHEMVRELNPGTEVAGRAQLVHKFLPESEGLDGRGEPEPADEEGRPVPWGQLLVAAVPDPDIARRLREGRGSLLEMRREPLDHLVQAYSHFYQMAEIRYEVEAGEAYCRPRGENAGGDVPAEDPEPWNTIAVPALLVASKALPGQASDAVLSFFDRLDRPGGLGAVYLRQLASELDDVGCVESAENPWRQVCPDRLFRALRAYAGRQRAENLILPIHRPVPAPQHAVPPFGPLYRRPELWIATAALAVLLLLWLRARRVFRRQRFFELPPKLAIGLMAAALILVAHLALLLVGVFEHRHYIEYATDEPSPYIRYDYAHLMPKLLDRATRGFSEEDFFPASLPAQVLMGVVVSGVVVSLLLAGRFLLPPLILHLRPYLSGGAKMKLKRHFVICNWHQHAAEVIRLLYQQERLEDRDAEVLVLTPAFGDVDSPLICEDALDDTIGKYRVYGLPLTEAENGAWEMARFFVIEGSPQVIDDLKRTQLQSAEAAIVFPEFSEAPSDSSTAITVLNIKRVAKCSPHEECEQPRIVLWCQDAANVDTLLALKVTDACSTEWAGRVICQATELPHVSEIYRNLMTASGATNELYELDYLGPPTTFDAIQQVLSRYNRKAARDLPEEDQRRGQTRNTVLPLGYCPKDDREKKAVNLNPDPEAPIDTGDRLVVLSYKCRGKLREKVENLLKETPAREEPARATA